MLNFCLPTGFCFDPLLNRATSYKFVTDYENTKHYKIKKAVRRDEKLFIGLTTKPRYELQIRSKQHN